MENILTVKNLDAEYKRIILKNISFNVNQGELICLIGPNGSGKSTLLSSLINVDLPNFNCSKNSVFVNNKVIDQMNRYEISKNISLMIQNENCVWNYSVFDFISMATLHNSYDEEKINGVLSLLKIEHLKNRSVNKLSGGEFQKVRIARTIYKNSSVMLFDEPVASLDLNYQFSLLNLIKNIVKENKLCAIISIHDINLATLFADKIFLLKNIHSCSGNDSQLLVGAPEEVLTKTNLFEVYNTNFETFIHPEYKKIQVYVKEGF